MTFEATPTTVRHASGVSPSKSRNRLPSGSSPGQYVLANSWFTIATGADESTSASLNSRPESIAALISRKYVGLIFRAESFRRRSSEGSPASWYESFVEPDAGYTSPVAADSTPGIDSSRGRRRSKNAILSSGRGYFSDGRFTDPPSTLAV